jgi:adenine deaminase
VNDLQAVALGDEPADLAITGGLLSGETTVSPPVEDGDLVADPENGLLKATLFDRHPDSDRGGFTGFLTGFDFDSGAVATSVVWETTGVLAVCANDADARAAVARVMEMGGG